MDEKITPFKNRRVTKSRSFKNKTNMRQKEMKNALQKYDLHKNISINLIGLCKKSLRWR